MPMNGVSRSVCALTVLALLFTVPVWARWLRSVGLNLGGFPGALQWLHRENERKAELNVAQVRCWRLLEARQRVIEDLAHGRLQLLEAARQWRDLNPGPHHQLADLLVHIKTGASDDERLCRHTIQLIENSSELPPEETRRVIARLEAELEEHLARHGTVVLPEPRPRAAHALCDGPGRRLSPPKVLLAKPHALQ
jgi:hypothetical protein